jgi:aspartyl/asparaginyl-tRNA synthetase
LRPSKIPCNWQRGLICTIVERVLTKRKAELKTLERDTALLERIASPSPRISYDQGIELLQVPDLRSSREEISEAETRLFSPRNSSQRK